MKTITAEALPPGLLIGQSRVNSVLDSTTIDPRAGEEWDRNVAQHPEATIFHTSAWAKVLCETYGHTPFYTRFSREGHTVALMPLLEVASPLTGRRGVCLPFSDLCGPLMFGEDSILDQLVELARARRWRYLELRATPAASRFPLAPQKTFYAHQLDLVASADQLLAGLSSAARRATRKAERSALRVHVAEDLKGLREFYLLHSQTRRRHGIPPQPFSFFRKIHEHILSRGLGFMVMAHLGPRPVAAAIFFHFQGHGVFKFGASDDRAQEHRANNLVMWEGNKQAKARGLTRLHLGRTDLEHEGLRQFKLSLGGREELLRYFRFDAAGQRWLPETSPKPASIAHALFRRLPLTINQLAGTVLYPHLH